jgi:FkbM family methyltransferase
MNNYRQFLKRTPAAPLLKSLYRRYSMLPTLVDVDGFSVRIPRRDVPRYVTGFEPLTTGWLRSTVRPGMVAVDVGAAIGLFSLTLARLVGASGRVIALEPALASVKLLKWNAHRNGVAIEVIAAAASFEDGTRTFFLTDSSDSHAFFHHPLISPSRRIEVQARRLDTVVASADFVKIDVEGAEIDVLLGAGALLEARPPLVVEWVPACQLAAGRSVDELPEWLARAGYRFEVFDELNHEKTTVAAALRAHERGELPLHWYANLCCKAA